MSLFKSNLRNSRLLSFFSLLGVLCVMLPWIHYPRLEFTLRGTDGDGILLSILFFLILIANGFAILVKSDYKSNVTSYISSMLSFIILGTSIYKVYAFYEDVNNFVSNDPLTSYAGAGVKLEYGLFVIIALSLICLFLSMFGGFFKKSKQLVAFGLVSIVVIGLSYFIYNQTNKSNRLDKTEIEENLIAQFDKMTDALKAKRTDLFVEYVHPILYQSIGGKAKMAELMSEAYNEVTIKDTKVEKLFKTHMDGDVVQVLLLQNITFISGMQETDNTNKSIAISYDGGVNWVFAGVEGRSFDEMKKVLPELDEALRY